MKREETGRFFWLGVVIVLIVSLVMSEFLQERKTGEAIKNVAPLLNSVLPNTIMNDQVNVVKLEGRFFSSSVAVVVNGNILFPQGDIQRISSTQIVVTIQQGVAPGVYNLQVYNADGVGSNMLPITISAASGQNTCSSVSRHGITWRFDLPVECGQFVNGDWWIVGPVTVASISPAQAPGRHGSWLNPLSTFASSQPFDDRIELSAYDASLRPTFPLVVNQPASLLSTGSHTTPSDCPGTPNAWRVTDAAVQDTCNRGHLRTAAVLTILSQAPPPDSFRPTYFGTDKTVLYNKNQVDYSRL